MGHTAFLDRPILFSVVHLDSFSELDGSPLALLGACLTTHAEPVPLAVLGAAHRGLTVVTGPAAFRPAVLLSAAERAGRELLFAADTGSTALLTTVRRQAADDRVASAALLARLSRLTCVALIVDDNRLTDPDCRAFVEELSRRAGADSPIAVFAWRRGEQTLSLSDPYRRLGLRPLSACAVSELFRARLPGDRADFHAPIGGNAVLVEAALDDLGTGAGTEFDRAVHQVLCGQGSTELPLVAQAVAILGEHGDPFVLSRVLGMSLSRLGELFDELIAIGLLAPGNTLRSRVRATVLAGTEPDVSRRLNLRAAEVLYQDAASPAVVARHLLAAGAAPETWAHDVLREAADRAEGRPDDAAALLGLALEWSVAPAARAELRCRLLDVRWWSDPAAAGGLLTALSAAARDGRLPRHRAARLARLMIWHARPDEARDLLRRAADTEGEGWLRHVFPGATDLGPAVPRDAEPVVAVRRGITPGADGLEAAQTAVFTLLGLERLDPGEDWFTRFAERAGGLPPWRSLLTAAQAAIALQEGDPGRAAALARRAVGDGPMSVLTALPRAVLLIARIELGRNPVVADPPPELMRSPYGLLHLRARGLRHLAGDAPQAAAGDFRLVGELLTSWGLELPGLLPWRVDLAEAVLRLGDRETARRLAGEHLARSDAPLSSSRARAVRLLERTGLSPAEGKVARLAAQGYSNREISGMLFITRSTVEQHLTRVYRKLGIERRDELCDAL
jgi:DNA-binding CsgD family transcriptional regulator